MRGRIEYKKKIFECVSFRNSREVFFSMTTCSRIRSHIHDKHKGLTFSRALYVFRKFMKDSQKNIVLKSFKNYRETISNEINIFFCLRLIVS